MNAIYGQANIGAISRPPNPGSAATDVVSAQAFDHAWQSITAWPGYQPSPLIALQTLADECRVAQIHYKDESSRFGVGSFKALGAPYAAACVLEQALQKDQINASVAAIARGELTGHCANYTLTSATDGNHGRALAWGCSRFGAPCRIYIHAEVSDFREQAMRDLGAEVIRIDGDYDESVRIAREESARNGWFVVSDTSWDNYTAPPTHVMAGYGVMIDEIVPQIDQPPTHVLVQAGVGGLAGAVCARLHHHYGQQSGRLIVVEPEWADCLYASAAKGQFTAVNVDQESIMAGLSCGEPSPLGWAILRELASDFVRIPDDLVAPTMRLLAQPTPGTAPVVAGESAVAGLATVLAASQQPELRGQLGIDNSSRILVFGTEGATDPKIYEALVNQ